MISDLDLEYRPGSDRGRLDLMRPQGAGPFPVVVCVHGGGWRNGAKESMHVYGREMVAAGYAAVAPNYRLTPTHPHPAQEQDIVAVLDWIADRAANFALDPRRIALTGASAGGHLTGLVGVKATRQPHPRRTLRCLLPVCGVFDVGRWGRDCPTYVENHIKPFLTGTAEDRPDMDRDSSAVAHVHRNVPPCLAIHGQADVAVPCNQSVLLVEALRRVGATAELMLIPGAGHAVAMPDGSPVCASAPYLGFLRRHL